MAKIRPSITDFAMGEVSPKLNGRIDLPLVSHAAEEMTNFIPWPLGGAGKRGGLKYMLPAGVSVTSKVRLIPWSISDDLDFMIMIWAGHVKILNVSGGQTPAFCQKDGVDIDITTLPGKIDLMYGESHVYDIKYAQSLNNIVMVHPDFPVFMITITGRNGNNVYMDLKTLGFTSNIAVTPEAKSVPDTYGMISYAQLANAVGVPAPWNATTNYTATGVIKINGVDCPIKNISVTKVAGNRQLEFNAWDHTDLQWITTPTPTTIPALQNFNGVTITDAVETVSCARELYLGGSVEYREREEWQWYTFPIPGGHTVKYNERRLVGSIGQICINGNETGEALINRADNLMVPGQNYIFSNQDGGWFGYYGAQDPGFGGAKYTKVQESTSLVLTYTEGTDKTISFDANTTGGFDGYVEISSLGLNINGYSVMSVDMVQNLAPWLTEGRPYSCDPKYKINSKTISTAMKRMTSSGPVIDLVYTDNTIETLTNSTTGVSGQVGVILKPMDGAGYYPSCVAFYQGRLCLGGSKLLPNVLYMSKVNEYTNFAFFEEIEYIQTALKAIQTAEDVENPKYETKKNINQQIGASSAIMLQIATDENEAILNLAAKDDLFIGTATSEWVFPAGHTALNPRVVLVSRRGSHTLQPKFIGNSIVFVSGSGRGIWEFGDPGQDLLKYAEHIAKQKIVSFDFRQDPNTEIYAVLTDGTAIVGRLSDEGVSWSRIRTYSGDKIESVSCIRASDEDAVYFTVHRKLGGAGTTRTIERLHTIDDSTFEGRVHLDYAKVFNSSSIVSTAHYGITADITARLLTATGEIEGTMTFNSDGTPLAFTPNGGVSGAVPEFTKAIIGVKFDSRIKTFRIDTMETEGLQKKAEAIHFRVYKSGRFNLVRDAVGTYQPKVSMEISMPEIDSVEQYPYSGPVRFENLSPWGTDQSVIVESSSSASVNLQTITPQFEIGEVL